MMHCIHLMNYATFSPDVANAEERHCDPNVHQLKLPPHPRLNSNAAGILNFIILR